MFKHVSSIGKSWSGKVFGHPESTRHFTDEVSEGRVLTLHTWFFYPGPYAPVPSGMNIASWKQTGHQKQWIWWVQGTGKKGCGLNQGADCRKKQELPIAFSSVPSDPLSTPLCDSGLTFMGYVNYKLAFNWFWQVGGTSRSEGRMWFRTSPASPAGHPVSSGYVLHLKAITPIL